MADLVVTFCSTGKPGGTEKAVPKGSSSRTTALLIGTVQRTSDVALAGDYVTLLARADCWVMIGPGAPTPVVLTSSSTTQAIASFPMSSGERIDRSCDAGDVVAVIAGS